MPPPNTQEKRKRKRKQRSRLEVSSSSSDSSSDSDSSSSSDETATSAKKGEPSHIAKAQKPDKEPSISTKRGKSGAELPADASPSSESSSEDLSDAELEAQPPLDFPSWYLRTVTSELADDLDKLRSAGDFSPAALKILVEALRQGESVFSEGEKRVILGS